MTLIMESKNNQEVIEYPDLSHLPDKSPREKLLLLLEFVKKRGQFSKDGQKQAVGFFMEWIGQLYLEYFQFHLNEARECAVPYRDLLLSLFEPIDSDYIEQEYHNFYTYSGWEDEDEIWNEMCWLCTNVAAFNDMFGKLTGPLFKDDMEGIEESMAGATFFQCGGKNEIQKIVPRTHWWWFAYSGEVLFKETIDFD